MGLTKPRAAQIYNLDYKQATRVVTVTNITLSGGAPNTVDGVNLSLNDRILVTGQDTGSQNGLYYVTTVGSGSNGTWARTSDGNETGEIEAGMIIMVTEGTVYKDTQWKLITDNPITIGSTTLTFTQNYSANSISGGTSNVTVYSNANVTISSAGTPNVLTVSSTGTVTSGTASVSGNITGGNVLTGGVISATGNITGDYFLGNVFYANGITASKIYSGTSEVNVVSSGGNVNVSVGGTSNVAVFASTGEYITGLLSVTGNVIGGNILTSGLISSTSNVTAGNVSTNGQVIVAGNINTVGALNINSTTGNYNVLNISGTALGPYGTPQTWQFFTNNIALGGSSSFIKFPDTSTQTTAYPGTSSTLSLSANITGGNINTEGNVSATGNIAGNYLLANIYYATGFSASRIFNGTSEANIGTADGNANISINGTSNVVVFAATGEYVTGLLSATGNITGSNVVATTALTNGNITITGANIVSSGPTIYIDPNGSGSTDGNVIITGNLSVQGNVTYINSNNITTNDLTINVANNAATAAAANGGGIGVGPADSEYISLTYNSTANIWVATNGLSVQGITSATGNVTGGNILTGGLISATGNITGGNILGNGRSLSGVNTFSSLAVTGSNTLTANSIATALTFTGDPSIVISANTVTNTVSFAFGGTGESIFATGGDMGLVDETPTAEEDLGLVTDPVTESYDLGGFFLDGLVSNDNFLLNSINGNILTTSAVISTTGNITAGYFIGNGSQLTGVTASLSGNLQGNINGNGFGANAFSFVSATGNITGGNLNTSGQVVATGNITGGNILGGANVNATTHTGTTVSVTGNITGGNILGGANVNATAHTGTTVSVTGNITGGNLLSTGAVYSNYNTNTANVGSFMAIGGNTKGGSGYLDFLVAQNTSGGATNPYKWLRVNPTGGLEIINSAYTATLLTLTDAGAFSVASTVSSTGFNVNNKQAVNGPAFRAYIDGGQAITSGSQQKVTFGSETFDTNANFASSRFTPTVEGYYQLNATVRISGTSGTGEIMITIWKNGSEYARGTNESGTEQGAGWYSMQVSDLAYANGSGDYFEIYIQQTSGGSRDTTAGQNISYFSGAMVRGA